MVCFRTIGNDGLIVIALHGHRRSINLAAWTDLVNAVVG